MLNEILVSPKTVIREKGDSTPVEIGAGASRLFLLTLEITAAVEQEGIELSLFGSADGNNWIAKPIATLPERFYAGRYPSLVDLKNVPGIAFLRAHWEVVRWGRGETSPYFEFSLTIREVSRESM